MAKAPMETPAHKRTARSLSKREEVKDDYRERRPLVSPADEDLVEQPRRIAVERMAYFTFQKVHNIKKDYHSTSFLPSGSQNSYSLVQALNMCYKRWEYCIERLTRETRFH